MQIRDYFLSSMFLLLSASCSSVKSFTTSLIDNDVAINNAVVRFTNNCPIAKKDSVFIVSSKLFKNDILGVTIFRYSLPIYATKEDTIGGYDSYFPTRFIVNQGRLFYWRDSTVKITKEMIDALESFNMLYYLKEGEFPDSYCSSEKVYDYYCCLRNPKIYRSRISILGVGGYMPPKMRCGKGIDYRYWWILHNLQTYVYQKTLNKFVYCFDSKYDDDKFVDQRNAVLLKLLKEHPVEMLVAISKAGVKYRQYICSVLQAVKNSDDILPVISAIRDSAYEGVVKNQLIQCLNK